MPKAKDRGGRPSKFTPQTALAIVADISEGRTRDNAAEAAGVGASTLYRWLQRGRAGDPRYADLARAIQGAQNGSRFGRALAEFVILGRRRF